MHVGTLFWGILLGSNCSRVWLSAFTHHQRQVPLCRKHHTQPYKTAWGKGYLSRAAPLVAVGMGTKKHFKDAEGKRREMHTARKLYLGHNLVYNYFLLQSIIVF